MSWILKSASHKQVTLEQDYLAIDVLPNGVTTIGAGRAVTPPLFDESKLQIRN